MYNQRARDKVAHAVNMRHQNMIRGESDDEMGCRSSIGVKAACEFQLRRVAAVLMRNQC